MMFFVAIFTVSWVVASYVGTKVYLLLEKIEKNRLRLDSAF